MKRTIRTAVPNDRPSELHSLPLHTPMTSADIHAYWKSHAPRTKRNRK